MIKIIAAVGEWGELGKAGDLIWQLPNDLKFFKSQTQGAAVLMGRNTYNSLPKKLPNRQHYVLTDSLEFNKDVDDVKLYFSFDAILNAALELAKTEDVFIIGGASIYKQFLPYADELILTEVEASECDADVYFPAFNCDDYDREVIATNEDNGIKYTHVRYTKRNKCKI